MEVVARFTAGLARGTQYRLERHLQGNANRVDTLYLRAPASYASQQVVVELRKDGREINRLNVPLELVQPGGYLVVGIGSDQFRQALNLLTTIQIPARQLPAARVQASLAPGQSARILVSGLPPARAPDRWQGYDAADLVVLGDVSERDFRPEQLAALRDWVRAGGTLVVVGGVNAGRFRSDFFADLLPVEVRGAGTADGLTGYAALAGGASPPSGSIPYVVAAPRAGARVEGRIGETPLLTVAPRGSGEVRFLPFDPTRPPFRDHPSLTEFWKQQLFRRESRTLVAALAEEGAYEPFAPSSGGRLAEAPYSIPQLDIPAFYVVALFLLAYIVVLVPLNYFLLKSRDRKEYAWITTPAIVLVFSVGAYVIGYGFKGGRTLSVSVAVVEARSGQDAAPAVGYTGLFSPSRRSYELRFAPGAGPSAGQADSWLFSAVESGERPEPVRIAHGETQVVERFGVDMWAMRIVQTSGLVPLGGGYRVEVHRSANGPRASLRNGTPCPLEDAYLVYGGRNVAVGALAPGESRTLDLPPSPPRAPGSLAELIESVSGESERSRVRRAALLPITSGHPGYGAGRPVLAGWTQGAIPAVEVDGRRPRALSATLVLIEGEETSVQAGGG